jgi:hypothetical protein
MSSHHLTNILIYLGRGCWYILVTWIYTTQLVSKVYHLLLLICLLLYLEWFGTLLPIIQIVWVWSLAIFLRIHVHACFVHSGKVCDLRVVLLTVLHVLIAACLVKESLRVNIGLVLVNRLGPGVTRLSCLILATLSTSTGDSVLLSEPLSGVVVGIETGSHVYLHDVPHVSLSLGIPVLHGIHESFYIFLIRCIRWK